MTDDQVAQGLKQTLQSPWVPNPMLDCPHSEVLVNEAPPLCTCYASWPWAAWPHPVNFLMA